MQEHTKEKILLYKAYLNNYLAVMCKQPYWNNIFIWEPFAGEGKLADGEKGSALCAAETIDGFRKEHSKKNIRLLLNELDASRYQNLERLMESYTTFVKVYNHDAKDFLSKVNGFLSLHEGNIHNLLFVDPYGYTQYTRENLTNLLKLSGVDYLIWMPTNSIYRFRRDEGGPARQFVLDLGVDKASLEDIKRVDSLAGKLVTRLKEIAGTAFGYAYKLVNKGAPNSIFHLFFITRNITGAKKFLEAKNEIKRQLQTSQLELFDVDGAQREEDVRALLHRPLRNMELYEEVIKKGHLPKEISPILKRMERDGEIQVQAGFDRRKGSFYLGNRNKTIRIKKVR